MKRRTDTAERLHNRLAQERGAVNVRPKEGEFHRTVAAFLDLILPSDAVYTTVPGGHRVATVAPGYRAGWPDIHILYLGQSLFIELKRLHGKAETHQKACHAAIRACGGSVVVCDTLDKVAEALTAFGIPPRVRVAA